MRFLAPLFVGLLGLAASAPALAYQETTVCLGVQEAANTDDEYYLAWSPKGTWEITAVTFAPATAVAADATDVVAFTIAINAGVASTSWTTIASETTDSDATEIPYVIGTVIDLTLTKPTNITHGYQVRIENTNGGSGKAWDGTYCFTAVKVK